LPGASRPAAGADLQLHCSAGEDGSLDWKPGLAGQRSHLLQCRSWRLSPAHLPVQPGPGLSGNSLSTAFGLVQAWFTERHDRTGMASPNGSPMQIGFEDHPIFLAGRSGLKGWTFPRGKPVIGAMLLRECESLIWMAKIVRETMHAPALHLWWTVCDRSGIYLGRE